MGEHTQQLHSLSASKQRSKNYTESNIISFLLVEKDNQDAPECILGQWSLAPCTVVQGSQDGLEKGIQAHSGISSHHLLFETLSSPNLI